MAAFRSARGFNGHLMYGLSTAFFFAVLSKGFGAWSAAGDT